MHFMRRVNLGTILHNRNIGILTTTLRQSMASNGAQNYDDYPFLRNCEKETIEPVSGTLRGTIPTWLQGELVRVGPGIQKIGNDQYKHVFDGLAILHKFTVKDGKAFYQSRALQSDAYKKNMEANRIVVSEFGTHAYPDPCQTLFGRLKTEFKAITSIFKKTDSENDITDNCSVNVAYYGDQLFAMTEANFTRRVDPEKLETFPEKTDISDYVAVNSATAHPHVLDDGTVINVGNIYRHAKGPHYGFIKVPPTSNPEDNAFANAKLIAEIPSRWKLHSSYFHSFGITNSGKLIFVEFPFCLNLLGLAAGEFLNRAYLDWIKWYPKEKTRFYVISMEDGKIHPVTYETDQLFLFHHINAYEEDGEIVVDVSGYSDAEWVSHITVSDTRKPGKFSDQPTARRYVLPLNIESAKVGDNLVKASSTATAKLRKEKQSIVDVTPQHFTNDNLELPRINYKYNGKNYKYFYGLEQRKPAETYEFGMDVISKVDVTTGEKISWNTDNNSRASEPIFVPDPTKANAEEDDGVILAALLPNDRPTSVSLLILNAKDMSEIGRAEFTALGAVTGTFHGLWAQSGEKLHAY